MHKCIEARDIYIYSPTDRLRSNGTSSFRTFSIRTTPIATFYYPSHSPVLAIVLLKLRYIQGVRLKSDVMRKLSESSRGGHGYGRRNSFLFRGERTNERPCSWKRTKFFITVGKRSGHAGKRERQRKSHVRYRTRPCLLNFKSRQSNYGGCSLNRAICSSRLNPHC